MVDKKNLSGMGKKFWGFFASVKLTVSILIIVAAASIIGTFIPKIDVYYSWWFRTFLIMLTLNIVVCSIDRISATWKIVFITPPPFNLSRFRKSNVKNEFSEDRSPVALEALYMPVVSRLYSYSRMEKTDEGFCIFAEKWRWTRLGVYVVHLSIVILLFGSLISSKYGFEGFVNIPEGGSASRIQIRKTHVIQDLGFDIQCNDFSVSYYDTDRRTPREFRSNLIILERGKPVLQQDIIVNNPLRYKGINIFQHSWGEVFSGDPPKEITLSFKSKETGMVYTKKTVLKQKISIPEGRGAFTVEEYTDAAEFRGHAIGPAFIGMLINTNGKKNKVTLPLKHPGFDGMRGGDMIISVVDLPRIQYTGLQITKDPGVPVVYVGFIVLIIGIAITFFMSHLRLCVDVRKKEKGSLVMVGGTSNRNSGGMQNRIERISARLLKL